MGLLWGPMASCRLVAPPVAPGGAWRVGAEIIGKIMGNMGKSLINGGFSGKIRGKHLRKGG